MGNGGGAQVARLPVVIGQCQARGQALEQGRRGVGIGDRRGAQLRLIRLLAIGHEHRLARRRAAVRRAMRAGRVVAGQGRGGGHHAGSECGHKPQRRERREQRARETGMMLEVSGHGLTIYHNRCRIRP